jgi:hypothetical protein
VPVIVRAEVSSRVPLDLDVTHQSCTARFCLPPVTDRISLLLLVPGTGADAEFVTPEITAAAGPAVRVEDMGSATTAATLLAYLRRGRSRPGPRVPLLRR